VDGREQKVSELLHVAGETHHAVFRVTDGSDDDWATWYSDWLVNLSELPDILGSKPVRSELTTELVTLDRQYTSDAPAEKWEDHYARALVERFGR
jgi:hypothetical protein